MIPVLTQVPFRLLNLLLSIMLQDVIPVKPLFCEILQLFIQTGDPQVIQAVLQLHGKLAVFKPGRHKFPSGILLGGKLGRGPDQGIHPLRERHIRFFKCAVPLKQMLQSIPVLFPLFWEIPLYFPQASLQTGAFVSPSRLSSA